MSRSSLQIKRIFVLVSYATYFIVHFIVILRKHARRIFGFDFIKLISCHGFGVVLYMYINRVKEISIF